MCYYIDTTKGNNPAEKEITTMKKLYFNESYDYNTKKYFWFTQRDENGMCAEIQKNDKGTFDLFICDDYKSTHSNIDEAMNESKKYVNGIENHIVRYYK